MAKQLRIIESEGILPLTVTQFDYIKEEVVLKYCKGCDGYHIEEKSTSLYDVCRILGLKKESIDRSSSLPAGVVFAKFLKESPAGTIYYDDLPKDIKTILDNVGGEKVIRAIKINDRKGDFDVIYNNMDGTGGQNSIEDILRMASNRPPLENPIDALLEMFTNREPDYNPNEKLDMKGAVRIARRLIDSNNDSDVTLLLLFSTVIRNQEYGLNDLIAKLSFENQGEMGEHPKELIKMVFQAYHSWREYSDGHGITS
jgi:hypothetical protein